MNINWNGATVFFRQFSLCQKIFMLAVLQKDNKMRAVILPVCIVPLNTEENVLPSQLFFTLTSFHCRLFKYGSFSVSTGQRHGSLEKTKLLLHRGHQRLGLKPKCQRYWLVYTSKAFGQPGYGCCLLPPRQALHISFTSCNKTSPHPHICFSPRNSCCVLFPAQQRQWELGFWSSCWAGIRSGQITECSREPPLLDSRSITAVSWRPCPAPSGLLQLEHQATTAGVALWAYHRSCLPQCLVPARARKTCAAVVRWTGNTPSRCPSEHGVYSSDMESSLFRRVWLLHLFALRAVCVQAAG